jgi:hypothetical protein
MIEGLLVGTLSIFITHLSLIAVFSGIGILVRRAFGLRRLRFDDCFIAFWVGWASAILFLIIWNFFLSVGGGGALAFVICGGGVGLITARRDLRCVLEGEHWRPSWGVTGILVLAGLWIANLSLGSLQSWDSSLYHLQGVKWATQYPVVPGLANLFGALGFNNASFLYAAMLDAGPWSGRANHLANGLLVLVMLLQTIVCAARFISPGASGGRSADLFMLFLLAPVIRLANTHWVASFVTDLPLTLLQLAAAARFYTMLSRKPSETDIDAYDVLVLVILMSAAVTLKVNAAVFAVIGGPMVVLLWLRRRPLNAPSVPRTLGWACIAAASFALVWMSRGIVLSGYPFFPLPVGGMPVDWRVPLDHAQAEYDYIVYSALRFSWTRFPAWAKHLFAVPFDVVVPLVLVGMGGIVWLWMSLRSNSDQKSSGLYAWWLALPVVASIVAWLIAAPDPRYVSAMTWSLAALCMTQVFRRLGHKSTVLRRRWVAIATCIGVGPAIIMPLLEPLRQGEPFNPIAAVLASNFNGPGSDHGFQPNSGSATVTPYITESGLIVNVPVERCWDAPLPCTPNPAPNLRLRKPDRLASGFLVEGAWQMVHWPEPWRPHFLDEWRTHRKNVGR